MIFNLYALYSENQHWVWFPKAYFLIDNDGNGSLFWRFAHSLVSKTEIKRLKPLFGTDDIAELKTPVKKATDLINNRDGRGYGYPSDFHSAPIISDEIKTEEIGTLN